MRPVPAAALVLAPVLGVLAYAEPGRAQGLERYDARDLSIERFVGLIEVETGGVDRVEAAWEAGAADIVAPRFEVRGDKLEIVQLRRRDDTRCRGDEDGATVSIERGDRHPIADYGRLTIRIPEGAKVEIGGGAPIGTVGDVGELSVGLGGCGDLQVGNVAGDAEMAVNGSGSLSVGAVGGRLSAAMNGSGAVAVGAVAGGLEAAINGSGGVQVASVEDDIEVAINGSGDVHILGGRARHVEAAIMGSGELRFDGVAQDVELASFGSGNVYVAEVSGQVETASFGSGRVRVGEDR